MNPINFNQNFGPSSEIKPYNPGCGGIPGNPFYRGQGSIGIHSNTGYVGAYGAGGKPKPKIGGSVGGGFGGGVRF